MSWKIIATKTFSNEFKKYRKNREFVDAIGKKIQRLKKDPHSVGGYLSGRLHGYKSARVIEKFRMIFRIDEKEQLVALVGIDHRKFDYKNF
ncbi:MAG: type II toxin-antitoxin system RelE/ParE family toxin [Deltaproteobacteria bacterium]|nr:type II toxin-antitoxin system RelE/ParE family toxin [Deltaproteobacteria bacterium]MBW1978960.1 type II toxin-antitoxin system RelE/ParE family toxin [Deltaproteobacteria bacterium]MBW2044464.1 type II toxin-antitoxin system RelE/ParE family toxin [Deltaproteobacteria bacterium]